MSSRGLAAGCAFALAATSLAPVARADTWSEIGDKGPLNPKLSERTDRNGVVLGLDLGAGLSGASGYPNASSEIDNAAYYSSSNLLVGTGSKFFVMGAFADYLSFGGWFGRESGKSGDWQSTANGGGLRLELFPLFSLVPSLKNLGVLTDFGVGGATLHERSGLYPDAHGVQSFLGAGVFYEWRVFGGESWHAVLGPSVEFDGVFSQSIASDTVLFGVRFALYTGK
jgi:hypothetical protein